MTMKHSLTRRADWHENQISKWSKAGEFPFISMHTAASLLQLRLHSEKSCRCLSTRLSRDVQQHWIERSKIKPRVSCVSDSYVLSSLATKEVVISSELWKWQTSVVIILVVRIVKMTCRETLKEIKEQCCAIHVLLPSCSRKNMTWSWQ